MFTIYVSQRASCQRGPTENQNESINNMIWPKCLKRVYVAKADLLFLFVNEMKGAHGRKSNARCKITKTYKKRRQVLRQL